MVTRTELNRIKEDYTWIFSEEPSKGWLKYAASEIRRYTHETRIVNICLYAPQRHGGGTLWAMLDKSQYVEQLVSNDTFQKLRDKEKLAKEEEARKKAMEEIKRLAKEMDCLYTSSEYMRERLPITLPKKQQKTTTKGGFNRFSGHWQSNKKKY